LRGRWGITGYDSINPGQYDNGLESTWDGGGKGGGGGGKKTPKLSEVKFGGANTETSPGWNAFL